jgi:aryl-alcohol dehydrogenase-like predicted oxidoreductase
VQYTCLGRTGLKVSRLCLGTMNFGYVTEEADSLAMMDRAVELGINLFDTANVYGGIGVTENIIGRWFAQGGGRRDAVVLATKLRGRTGEGANEGGLSAYHIRRACEASLRRLQTDHIDLYQMHHVERGTPWDEIWQAMEQLVREGKITYVGSSNFAGWDIAKANEAADRRHFLGLVSEQALYNLHGRMIELEVIPACRDYGLSIIPYCPQSGGLLCGVLEKLTEGRRTREDFRLVVEKFRGQIEPFESFCRQQGRTPSDIALAWVLANPVVASPIIGPRTLEQLDACTGALDVTLDEKAMQRLDEIWPGPGGEAPDAWDRA